MFDSVQGTGSKPVSYISLRKDRELRGIQEAILPGPFGLLKHPRMEYDSRE